MQRLVDRILRRARLAGEGPAAAAFSFDHDLPALLDTLRRMYGEKDLEFEIEVPAAGAVLAIDREDILELLGNLLDNACKWARRTVRLTVDADADVHLTGGDDQAGASRHPAR
jgi:signal transduction histidine kinase